MGTVRLITKGGKIAVVDTEGLTMISQDQNPVEPGEEQEVPCVTLEYMKDARAHFRTLYFSTEEEAAQAIDRLEEQMGNGTRENLFTGGLVILAGIIGMLIGALSSM